MDSTEPVEVAIGYADSEADRDDIHRFLLMVAKHRALCPIDPVRSLEGIIETMRDGVAITARIKGWLVGSFGLTAPTPYWYGDGNDKFMSDRWFFVYPDLMHTAVGGSLLGEAHAIAANAGHDLIVTRHPRRKQGALFHQPVLIPPGAVIDNDKVARDVLRQ